MPEKKYVKEALFKRRSLAHDSWSSWCCCLKCEPKREKLNYHLMSLRAGLQRCKSASSAVVLFWSRLCAVFHPKLFCHWRMRETERGRKKKEERKQTQERVKVSDNLIPYEQWITSTRGRGNIHQPGNKLQSCFVACCTQTYLGSRKMASSTDSKIVLVYKANNFKILWPSCRLITLKIIGECIAMIFSQNKQLALPNTHLLFLFFSIWFNRAETL